jgi:hypothetical protein
VIDKRTTLGRALARWRADLVNDLGGPAAVSVQQQAIVDLCVREKLMVDSLDTWIVQQPTLINKRSRSVLPVVRERTQIADALARHLASLGLERRKPPAEDLATYLRRRYGNDGDGHETATQNAATPPGDAKTSTPGSAIPDADVAGQRASGAPGGARRRTPVTLDDDQKGRAP